ncbi:hypothetical protein I2494_05425 [Budviciaceae bacterium BWR-B9]|uniref:Uncharacterized protein n=1 Tax=Limnobaculum allomyrinae TaxID=2791986 RepID=A0ABS1IN36_9GAMM|nr:MULTISPECIES: hypothetical protein [Limnobaculum]MBK5143158.1 hypothetical protein [Limnobaculum allomyrinae]MBV7691046.1 hypothetical protein [Limnobaculum sp. M2-1]
MCHLAVSSTDVATNMANVSLFVTSNKEQRRYDDCESSIRWPQGHQLSLIGYFRTS